MLGTRNIILIGMMGSGKTTCGQLLAERTGWALIDTDLEIEQRQGRSISQIFALQGEQHFRKLEEHLCRELEAPNRKIIACGGGLPIQEACRNSLRQGGTIVWLERDPSLIYNELDVAGRPLAQQGHAAFMERYAAREPIYRGCADIIIHHPTDPKAAVAEILQKLEERQ